VAKQFSGIDTRPWKLMNGNAVVKNGKGEALNQFKGYKDAAEASRSFGGVPVRA
jgi:hypothetical protein